MNSNTILIIDLTHPHKITQERRFTALHIYCPIMLCLYDVEHLIATFVAAIFAAVTAVFGMNLRDYVFIRDPAMF